MSTLSHDDLDTLAVLAKALGHPTRVRLLQALVQRASCVCGDLVEDIGAAQSTVSEHLRVLKDAGLVRGEISGRNACYCIDPAGLHRLHHLLGTLIAPVGEMPACASQAARC